MQKEEVRDQIKTLVEQAMKGDEEAFEELIKQKMKSILYLAVRLLNNNRDDAEDAVQEVSFQVYKHLPELKDPEVFDRWLYRIVYNTCADMRRKKVRLRIDMMMDNEKVPDAEELTREFVPHEYIEDKERREWLLKIVDSLPYKRKTCVLMHYYQGMSHKEIAEIMGVSVSAVNNNLQKARETIRKQLSKKYPDYKKLISAYSLAPVPVLAQVLRLDADSLIVPEQMARMWNNIAAMIAPGSGAAALYATNGASAASGGGSTLLGGTSAGVKLAIGAVAATGMVTAGAITLHQVRQAKEIPAVISEEIVEQERIPEEVTPSEIVITDVPQETPQVMPAETIDTLADMVGEDWELKMQEYAAQGIADGETFERMVDELELKQDSFTEGENASFALYVLDKADKRLMVIEKYDAVAGVYQMVYRFTDITEELPYFTEIAYTYGVWSGEGQEE